MTRAEALAVLALQDDPTAEDISIAYRSLAATHHPDTGGDGAAMARLTEARDHLLVSTRNTTMVTVKAIHDIVTLAAQQSMQLQADRAVRERTASVTYQAILRLATSPLQAQKRVAARMGILSGGMALLTTQISSTIDKLAPGLAGGSFSVTCAALAALCGAMYWYTERRAKLYEAQLVEIAENLADRDFFRVFLKQVMSVGNVASPTWSRMTLVRALGDWSRVGHSQPGSDPGVDRPSYSRHGERSVAKLVRRLGEEEVARLVITKRLENEYLSDNASIVDGAEGGTTYSYSPRTAPAKG